VVVAHSRCRNKIERMFPVLNNMNSLCIPTDDYDYSEPLTDYGAVSADGGVEVVFKDLPRALIKTMHQYEAGVGCVAWLTHFDILDAMARLKTVSIVVQKEDFLRPDMGMPSNWKDLLRAKYNALPGDLRWSHTWDGVGGLSYCGDPTLDGVRCVGNYNSEKSPAFPRAHHKFMVFGDIQQRTSANTDFVPRVVWTGSFNFTVNATNSFENAVILRDPAIVNAFYQEWGQMVALSEPLDWTSEWVAPEFRIGS